MKGLILCAGKGTRLRPFSYSQPKPLLPVANNPVLFYSIQSLVNLGIKDIGVVINSSQEKVMKEKLGTGNLFGASITYIYQPQAKGIADAVKQAEPFIEGEPFLLLLGDNIIQENLTGLITDIEEKQVNGSIILSRVKNPHEFGIAEIDGERIISIEEKPAIPKSNLAVIGAYTFDSAIFKAIDSISPSVRGEYEITDAIQWMLNHNFTLSYSITTKGYSDVGTIERWLQANRWKLDDITNGENMISEQTKIINCELIPPVIIDSGCDLKNSIIGPYVSIASHSKIDGCKIENSIILEGAHLEQIAHKIVNSVFGLYSEVRGSKNQSKMVEYILGDKASVIDIAKDETKE